MTQISSSPATDSSGRPSRKEKTETPDEDLASCEALVLKVDEAAVLANKQTFGPGKKGRGSKPFTNLEAKSRLAYVTRGC